VFLISYILHTVYYMIEIYLPIFLLLGSMVILSYGIYLPEDEAVWAGLRWRPMFYVWLISSCVSATAFLVLTVTMVMQPYTDMGYYLLIPYTIFLLCSSFYMPLVFYGYKINVIIVLGLVAYSTHLLWYDSMVMFGWNYITILLIILAFHCTVIDFGYWGFTWNPDEQSV
jgi:hypothetical protein